MQTLIYIGCSQYTSHCWVEEKIVPLQWLPEKLKKTEFYDFGEDDNDDTEDDIRR